MDGVPLRIEGLGPALGPGQVLALLGEDAAATVLGLAGFGVANRAGFLGEKALAGLPPHRRNLGVVLDPPGLFPELTLAQNIAWPLRPRPGPKAARVADSLAALGLEARAAELAGPLAPGEARLVALARALARAPAALLLLHPFLGLEDPAREALALRLRHLGPPVLLASSDAATALLAADRVAVLHHGRLLQHGTSWEVYNRPAEALVASLTGEANFLAGKIAEVFDDECRVALDNDSLVEATLAAPLLTTPFAIGARCRVMLRPADVAVAAVAPETMGEGALAATLLEAVFLGSQIRLRLALAGGGELLARRPAGLRLPSPGDTCAVAWNTSQAIVFAA